MPVCVESAHKDTTERPHPASYKGPMHGRLCPQAIDPAVAWERDCMVRTVIWRVDGYRLRM